MKELIINNKYFFLVFVVLVGCSRAVVQPTARGIVEETFTNPLLPAGADPWVIYQNGYYYYTHTIGDKIGLWKTKDITDLKNALYKTIWTPPVGTNHSHDLWAPEIMYINRNWYVYYAADDGKNETHQLFVLENTSKDPFEGSFQLKSKLNTDANENWAIDGSVFEWKGTYYIVWSGWESPRIDTETQRIYIAKMENPWTIGSDRVLISQPEHTWEKMWQNPAEWKNTPSYTVHVNEGPQVLKHNNKLFITYSASGCWTPNYSLGMLTTDISSNILDATAWVKSTTPLFQQSPENGVYGPGHNSFFKSPDGTEDWFLYHANVKPEQGCGDKRSPRAQKITWKVDGTPDLGKPLATDTPIKKPSGTNR